MFTVLKWSYPSNQTTGVNDDEPTQTEKCRVNMLGEMKAIYSRSFIDECSQGSFCWCSFAA